MWSFLTIHHSLTTFISASLNSSPFPFDDIASQANKSATETIASLQQRDRLPQHSRFRNWPDDGVTSGDLKAFLAMIIAMGLVNQENIQDY